jgi:hypothetical protein
MVVEQKALVEEALNARSLLRACRAYLQAINSGAKPAVALEASVNSLMEADPTMSEGEARITAGREIEQLEESR